MKRTLAYLMMGFLLSSCAHIEIRPLTQDEKEAEQEAAKQAANDPAANKEKASQNAKLRGVRFYRATPYLLVKQTSSEGACDVSIVYYPNRADEYIIIPHRGIGVVTFNPTLADGWNLTAFSATVDSKVPEMLTAVAALITAGTGAAKLGVGGAAVPTEQIMIMSGATETALAPGLYKISFDAPLPTFSEVFIVKQPGPNGPRHACKGFSAPPPPPKSGN